MVSYSKKLSCERKMELYLYSIASQTSMIRQRANVADSSMDGVGWMPVNKTFRHILRGGSLLMLLAAAVTNPAKAQPYPSNTIRIVAPTGPGAPPDVISRIIAAELVENEGWRVVVENRPGALQTIALSDVLKQPADGYSVFPMTVGVMATPALLPGFGLRLDTDLTPVIKISTSYNALVVTPSLPAKSVSELVVLLKSQPDKLNISASAFGTPSHLLAEVFKLQAGVRATVIPYQQQQQRMTDLLNGTNQFAFYNTPAVVNLIDANKLRGLAITAPKRMAALKDVPTIVEQGFPGLVGPGEDWVGFAVKNGTPNEIITRLNRAVNNALTKQKTREALASLGAEAVGGTPAEFGSLINSQLVYWSNVVKESGIKVPQ
jgi:tripartite-type tricarboxylate transporter receptor subunit TctC